MSELDDLKDRVTHLQAQEKLEHALATAGAKYADDPTDANLARHNKAAEALVEHRGKARTEGGPKVGGDAVMVTAEGDEQ